MQNMNELSASFRRYFQDEDSDTVKKVSLLFRINSV